MTTKIKLQTFDRHNGWQTLETFDKIENAQARRIEIELIEPGYIDKLRIVHPEEPCTNKIVWSDDCMKAVEAQRDELLAALRDILEDSCDLRLLVANKIEFGKRIANKARAAIAATEQRLFKR